MGQLISTIGQFSKKGISRALAADPDDKWSNLHREREKNSLYKIVGIRSGGELIEVFEKEGEEGVLRFADELLTPSMYNNGEKAQELTFGEYIKWKNANMRDLGKADDSIDMVEAEKTFMPHPVQYKMNKRGIQGETIIHLLLNRGEPTCTEIARILLKRYPGLALDWYEGDEMYGQTPLHLAIVHDDCDTVQLLLECGASVNARACGEFFIPEDQKNGYRSTSNYQGYAYYGEYPLAFAACFGNKDIYDLLIQNGADPNLQDFLGNTILHMCVISYSNTMYSYAVHHWRRPAHPNVTNFAGMTPLTLATKLGRKDIFEEMLELMKVEFWRFGDVTCSAYPLTALDTIRPDGSTNYDSALMTVINGNTVEHLEMIGSEVIQRLIADKWKAFAKWKLFERLGHMIFHTICLCFAIYTRPTEPERIYFHVMRWDDYIRVVFEILLILSTLYFVFIQQVGELRTQGFYGYVRNLRTTPAKVFFSVACIILLLCVPCRFLHLVRLEEALLVFALPASWIFFLFFARLLKSTGPFVQMIYSMIAGDILRFAVIAAIFLISFSKVFYFMGKDMSSKQWLADSDENDCSITGYNIYTFSSFLETFVTLFRATMSGYDYEEFGCTNYEPMTKGLFVLFMFIMPIMMINILIAMMGNTYTKVIVQAEKAWKQQYAQIVMVLERSLSKEKLAESQLKYSIALPEEFGGGMEVRGLMVYKQTKKTRAQQRKHAINNWKLISRKVLDIVERHGVDHALYLLHSNERLLDEPTVIITTNDSKPPTREINMTSRLAYCPIATTDSPPEEIIIEKEVRSFDLSGPASTGSTVSTPSHERLSECDADNTSRAESVRTPSTGGTLKRVYHRHFVAPPMDIPNIPNMPSAGNTPPRVPVIRSDMFVRKDSNDAFKWA